MVRNFVVWMVNLIQFDSLLYIYATVHDFRSIGDIIACLFYFRVVVDSFFFKIHVIK